ncbi:SGNH/GDSL hydrolase family protein [Kaistia geumhonensis]|uniref:Lysophospholipase L1-like esterase n=1 Tax=Kaistia geumhonensis TaxID=410839 RepID=A0ABU0M2Y9_9HYPH|nr:SGNH/GDSL hydrolase family protein [Kaistia geumhonensis]MCX5479441.1 SGNH/GDSL hydrolase family protein [Kaistia geumhonensis]MDQ0515336.1 lysophospholipase L1-like esterase [Kaistia geumhonensis]
MMKTVLAYGDSNTWGAATVARPDDRYAWEERWPGVMAAALGEGWRVIEEGLPGRTTVHDDPVEGAYMNGKTYLMPCLRSHRPLDVVAIMLGSNDLKARFAVPGSDIAAGAGELVKVVKQAEAGRNGDVPKILLIAPAPMLNHTGERPDIGRMFVGGYEKSLELAPLYRAVAEAHGVAFLDAGTVMRSSAYDGLHLDPDAHQALGKAVAVAVAGIA